MLNPDVSIQDLVLVLKRGIERVQIPLRIGYAENVPFLIMIGGIAAKNAIKPAPLVVLFQVLRIGNVLSVVTLTMPVEWNVTDVNAQNLIDIAYILQKKFQIFLFSFKLTIILTKFKFNNFIRINKLK